MAVMYMRAPTFTKLQLTKGMVSLFVVSLEVAQFLQWCQ